MLNPFLSPNHTACTPIANSTGPLTCTNLTDSKAATGFSCLEGFFLGTYTGMADVCTRMLFFVGGGDETA